MMTSSNGNIFRVTGPLRGEITGHRCIPNTKASDAELWCFFICAWINAWVNNREAGDLRRHRAHYGVTVMTSYFHILGYIEVPLICWYVYPPWHIYMILYIYIHTHALFREPTLIVFVSTTLQHMTERYRLMLVVEDHTHDTMVESKHMYL